MLTQLHTKPVTFEAIEWTGNNAAEMKNFVGHRDNDECRFLLPEEITGAWEDPHLYDEVRRVWLPVYSGHWVIKGLKGEFYSLPRDVLAEMCELAPSQH